MPLPELNSEGYSDPGIYLASLEEILQKFGTDSPAREQQGNLLRLIVERARNYSTIKRVLIWGSFVSAKLEPGDLDYSIVVNPRHQITSIAQADSRFFTPIDAKIYYGVDKGYLVLYEYPPEYYAEAILFFCQDREGWLHGILEVSCDGQN